MIIYFILTNQPLKKKEIRCVIKTVTLIFPIFQDTVFQEHYVLYLSAGNLMWSEMYYQSLSSDSSFLFACFVNECKMPLMTYS